MENDKGFSLIEVIASIVILSIVLLSFFQIFIQTNKTAVSNNEKLVVINLADAQLERLKLMPLKSAPSDEGVLERPGTGVYNKTVQLAQDKLPNLNGHRYPTEIHASQDAKEKGIKLIKVKVTVTAKNGKTKSSVEGYVSYE